MMSAADSTPTIVVMVPWVVAHHPATARLSHSSGMTVNGSWMLSTTWLTIRAL